jgi:hypothetical protein
MKCITGLEVKLFKGVSCDMFAMSALSNMLRNIDTAKSGHVDTQAISILNLTEPCKQQCVTSLHGRGHFSGALLPRDSSDLNGDSVWSDTSL